MPESDRPAWRIGFYQDRRGRSPVEEFLDDLNATERAEALRVLRLLREFCAGRTTRILEDREETSTDCTDCTDKGLFICVICAICGCFLASVSQVFVVGRSGNAKRTGFPVLFVFLANAGDITVVTWSN